MPHIAAQGRPAAQSRQAGSRRAGLSARTGDAAAATVEIVVGGIDAGAAAQRGAARLARVAAGPGARIARAGAVALVERRAGHRVSTHAGAGPAGVDLRAGVSVRARRSVLHREAGARPRGWIAHADMTLVRRRAGDRRR